MENAELIKTYHLADEHVLEKTVSTEITWKNEDKNPTKKKVKKKQKNKKTGATRTVTKTEDQDSFFSFFESLTLPNAEAMDEMDKDKADELAGRLDEDYDLGNDIMSDIVPEAFELYLGVVDKDYSSLNSGSEDDDDEDDEESNNDDEKDDKKPPSSPGSKGDNVE